MNQRGKLRGKEIVALLLPFSFSLLGELPTAAQVTADNTVGTVVTPSMNQLTITGGTQQLNTLFHSFTDFSPGLSNVLLQLGGNQNTVNLVIGRVTGGRTSFIDGQLQLTGGNSPDLFLINPNGITFGPNASLLLPGSFLAGTAASVLFSNGLEFSATNPGTAPLLTISIPIGLQLNNTAGAIVVNGSGHTYTSNNSALAPVIRTPATSGLAVSAGKSLTLIGQGVTLNGGQLMAEPGYITLASLQSGAIALPSNGTLPSLTFSDQTQFAPLSLVNQSLVDVSGFNAGGINLYGSSITLTDGSLLLSQNVGPQTGGNILVQASDSLRMIGTNPAATVRSSIISETLGNGAGGNIQVSSQQFYVADGASIFSRNYGTGNGGSIITTIADQAALSGFSSQLPREFSSAILTEGFGPGQVGDIYLTSRSLTQTQGGAIGSITFGSGQGGKVTIAVTDEINLQGVNPFLVNPSVLGATTFGAANAGELTVTARRIVLENGARIDSSTYNSGSAGQVTVQASEEIRVAGAFPNSAYRSYIGGAALSADEPLRQALGLPLLPTGNGGDVLVTVPSLRVTSGGVINVRNEGTGNAGALKIIGDNVIVEKGGQITADTASGGGGDITLQVSKVLLLREQGLVSAEALGSGKGGNITITAPIIVGFNNSDVIANAVQGEGGNIQITTQGIFGLQYRNQRTLDNDITASSQYGVSGVVDIVTSGIDPNSGLIKLPADITDPSQKIAQGCVVDQGSSFVITGRGGVPPPPMTQTSSDRPWSDTRDLSSYRSSRQATYAPQSTRPAPLVEATGWRRNAKGDVEVYTTTGIPANSMAVTCANGGHLRTSDAVKQDLRR